MRTRGCRTDAIPAGADFPLTDEARGDDVRIRRLLSIPTIASEGLTTLGKVAPRKPSEKERGAFLLHIYGFPKIIPAEPRFPCHR